MHRSYLHVSLSTLLFQKASGRVLQFAEEQTAKSCAVRTSWNFIAQDIPS